MRRAPIVSAAVLAILAATPPAVAAGGLSCTAEDRSLRFSAGTGVSHGMGGAFFDFRATLEISAEGLPADLARLDLDADALTHSWLDADEARLQLYHERAEGDFASVDLVVETEAAGEEGAYDGTYSLTVFGAGPDHAAWSATGRASCLAE